MSPVFILVISILIVVIAILVLRLHAFLALLKLLRAAGIEKELLKVVSR